MSLLILMSLLLLYLSFMLGYALGESIQKSRTPGPHPRRPGMSNCTMLLTEKDKKEMLSKGVIWKEVDGNQIYYTKHCHSEWHDRLFTSEEKRRFEMNPYAIYQKETP